MGCTARFASIPWHEDEFFDLVGSVAKIVAMVGGVGVVAGRTGVYLIPRVLGCISEVW
jgi:hypothetical protein